MFPINEKGQGLAEYELAIALVAIVVIAILLILGVSIGDLYNVIVDALPF